MASFSDNYNRANGGLGADYATIIGSPGVVSNTARPTTVEATVAVVEACGSFADGSIEVTYGANDADETSELIVRSENGGADGLSVLITAGTIQIVETISSTPNVLASASVVPGPGDRVKLLFSGASVAVRLNGAPILSGTTAKTTAGEVVLVWVPAANTTDLSFDELVIFDGPIGLVRTQRFFGATAVEEPGNDDPFSSGSFTPSANSTLVVAAHIEYFDEAGSPVIDGATIDSSTPLDWRRKVYADTSPGEYVDGYVVWEATIGDSPVSMTVTVDPGGQKVITSLLVVDYTSETGTPFVTANQGLAGSFTAGVLNTTLDSEPATSSEVIGLMVAYTFPLPTITPGSGWTEIAETTASDYVGIQYQARTGSTSDNVQWTVSTSGDFFAMGGFAFEVSQAEPSAITVNAGVESSAAVNLTTPLSGQNSVAWWTWAGTTTSSNDDSPPPTNEMSGGEDYDTFFRASAGGLTYYLDGVDGFQPFSWTNGTPTGSDSGVEGGAYREIDGFTLDFPVVPGQKRRLRVYCGVYSGAIQVSAGIYDAVADEVVAIQEDVAIFSAGVDAFRGGYFDIEYTSDVTGVLFMDLIRTSGGSGANVIMMAMAVVEDEGGGGSGEMAGSVAFGFSASGAASGRGALTGSSSLSLAMVGGLSGIADLEGSVDFEFSMEGDPQATGALASVIPIAFSVQGVLEADGALEGAAALSFTPSGALTADGALEGLMQLLFSASGDLSSTADLVGDVDLTFAVAGAPTGAGELAGDVDLALSVAGEPSGSGAMTGAASLTFTAAGVLLAPGEMNGAMSIALAVAGEPAGAGAMTGNIALLLSQVGELAGAGALASTVSMAFGLVGTLTEPSGAMTGSVALELTVAGAPTGAGAMDGAVEMTFSVDGTLIEAGVGHMDGVISLGLAVSGGAVGFYPINGAAALNLGAYGQTMLYSDGSGKFFTL